MKIALLDGTVNFATPPTCRLLPTSASLQTVFPDLRNPSSPASVPRLPRPPCPVFPEGDMGPSLARVTPMGVLHGHTPLFRLTGLRCGTHRWMGGAIAAASLPPDSGPASGVLGRDTVFPGPPSAVFPDVEQSRRPRRSALLGPSTHLQHHSSVFRLTGLQSGTHGRRTAVCYRHQPAAHYPHPAFSEHLLPPANVPGQSAGVRAPRLARRRSGTQRGAGYLVRPAA